MKLVSVLWIALPAVFASYDGTGTSWRKILAQSGKVFTPVLSQAQKASEHECAMYCHSTRTSVSLTFTHSSQSCRCYVADHQHSEASSNETGAIFMTRRNDTQSYNVDVANTPCSQLYQQGHTTSGVYSVTIGPDTFDVYCDMIDGGWTVVQHRFDGSLNFTRNWVEYENGFGSAAGEYWLGLSRLYTLTQTPREVYFNLEDVDGVTSYYLHYSSFSISTPAFFYKLTLGGFVGGIHQQSFLYCNGKEFHTYDRDNTNTCALRRFGGWWFSNCVYLNINGKYGLYDQEAGMIEHYQGYKNLRSTTMKIK